MRGGLRLLELIDSARFVPKTGTVDLIEACLAVVTAPLVSGRSCVEGSVGSVRSVVCAQFVSVNF